jgi:hypothetical protein
VQSDPGLLGIPRRPTAIRSVPSSRRRQRSGSTHTAFPTRPRCPQTDIRSTVSTWPVTAQLDLIGDYKSNAALYPTFQDYFRTASPRSWRYGARTIRSSCRQRRRRSNATFQTRSSAFSTPGVLRWRCMPQRSRKQSGIYSPVEPPRIPRESSRMRSSWKSSRTSTASFTKRFRILSPNWAT